MVTRSRLGNYENGDHVAFEIGETVKYKLLNGKVIDIKIDSKPMSHKKSDFGFEAIFSDDGERYFADSKRIVDWEGKGSCG
jgi:hypothetical protein